MVVRGGAGKDEGEEDAILEGERNCGMKKVEELMNQAREEWKEQCREELRGG